MSYDSAAHASKYSDSLTRPTRVPHLAHTHPSLSGLNGEKSRTQSGPNSQSSMATRVLGEPYAETFEAMVHYDDTVTVLVCVYCGDGGETT